MKKISEQVINLIVGCEKGFAGEIGYEELKEAADDYNEMVKMGIAKKRGYSLLSIEQTNIKQPSFNY